MRILLVGGAGTIGHRLRPALETGHEILVAGRSSGDVRVDITSAEAIERMYQQTPGIDAVVGIAASGALDDFATLTGSRLHENMKGKFYGQVDLVLIGQRYVRPGGSFTLTSGIFADEPAKSVTAGGVISGALHSFVLSAALELRGRFRVNCISPTMVSDSVDALSAHFPGLSVVPMDELVRHYVHVIEGDETGRIIRAYGPRDGPGHAAPEAER